MSKSEISIRDEMSILERAIKTLAAQNKDLQVKEKKQLTALQNLNRNNDNPGSLAEIRAKKRLQDARLEVHEVENNIRLLTELITHNTNLISNKLSINPLYQKTNSKGSRPSFSPPDRPPSSGGKTKKKRTTGRRRTKKRSALK
tara:strand:+ start:437 stop:868 length:432 start_codon:yes stop_codon:yes gene_type:complete